MTDILDDLRDLHKQATTERSHYYVAKCAERAIAEITRLTADNTARREEIKTAYAVQTLERKALATMRAEIARLTAERDRLLIGHAVIVRQVGFYKPETPDFEFVRIPLGILRRALYCVPPPYPEDGINEQSGDNR